MTRVHSAATASHSGKEERSLEALMGRYIGKPLPGITTGTKPPSTSATATATAAGDDNNYGNDALEDSVHLQEYNTKRSKLAFFKQQEGVRVISSNNTNKDNKDKDKDESLKRSNASRRHKISNAFNELQRTIEEGYSTEFEVEIEGDGEGEGDDLLLEVEGVVDADGYQDKDEDRDPRSLSTKSAVGTLITPNSTPSFSSKKKLNICNDNASISGTSCHNKRSVHELVNKSNWADGGARKDSETAERRRMKNTNNSHVHHPYDYGGIEVSNSDDCNNNVQPSPLSFSEKEFLTESLADYIKHTPKNTIYANNNEPTTDLSSDCPSRIDDGNGKGTPTLTPKTDISSTANMVTPYSVLNHPKHKSSRMCYSDCVMMAAESRKTPMASLTRYLREEQSARSLPYIPNGGGVSRAVTDPGQRRQRRIPNELPASLLKIPFDYRKTQNDGDGHGEADNFHDDKDTEKNASLQSIGKSVAKSMKKTAKKTKRNIGRKISKISVPSTKATTAKSKSATNSPLNGNIPPMLQQVVEDDGFSSTFAAYDEDNAIQTSGCSSLLNKASAHKKKEKVEEKKKQAKERQKQMLSKSKSAPNSSASGTYSLKKQPYAQRMSTSNLQSEQQKQQRQHQQQQQQRARSVPNTPLFSTSKSIRRARKTESPQFFPPPPPFHPNISPDGSAVGSENHDLEVNGEKNGSAKLDEDGNIENNSEKARNKGRREVDGKIRKFLKKTTNSSKKKKDEQPQQTVESLGQASSNDDPIFNDDEEDASYENDPQDDTAIDITTNHGSFGSIRLKQGDLSSIHNNGTTPISPYTDSSATSIKTPRSTMKKFRTFLNGRSLLNSNISSITTSVSSAPTSPNSSIHRLPNQIGTLLSSVHPSSKNQDDKSANSLATFGNGPDDYDYIQFDPNIAHLHSISDTEENQRQLLEDDISSKLAVILKTVEDKRNEAKTKDSDVSSELLLQNEDTAKEEANREDSDASSGLLQLLKKEDDTEEVAKRKKSGVSLEIQEDIAQEVVAQDEAKRKESDVSLELKEDNTQEPKTKEIDLSSELFLLLKKEDSKKKQDPVLESAMCPPIPDVYSNETNERGQRHKKKKRSKRRKQRELNMGHSSHSDATGISVLSATQHTTSTGRSTAKQTRSNARGERRIRAKSVDSLAARKSRDRHKDNLNNKHSSCHDKSTAGSSSEEHSVDCSSNGGDKSSSSTDPELDDIIV